MSSNLSLSRFTGGYPRIAFWPMGHIPICFVTFVCRIADRALVTQIDDLYRNHVTLISRYLGSMPLVWLKMAVKIIQQHVGDLSCFERRGVKCW